MTAAPVTLITGGTGFIGSYLTRLLVSEGHEVVIYDRFPNRTQLTQLEGSVTVIEGDVLDDVAIEEALRSRGVNGVVHLAGAPGAVFADRTVQYSQLMCLGAANVFEAARRCGIRRVVNASSVAVYGFEQAGLPPVAEDHEVGPTDLYGASKLWSEGLARVHNEKSEMEILSLRICSALGIGRLNRASLAAGLTVERITVMAYPELAAHGQSVTMPPDEQLFDFIYAPDVARAFALALTAPRPQHSVFNLRAQQAPYGEVTKVVRECVPDAEITVAAEPLSGLQLRLMDSERIARELNFRPQFTLEEAVRDYVETARQQETVSR